MEAGFDRQTLYGENGKSRREERCVSSQTVATDCNTKEQLNMI